MSSQQREIEITFVVRSDDPRAIVARLESLQELAGYRLRLEPPRHLHDRYFDLLEGRQLPDGRLRARGYALRLRQVEDRFLLCLKGRSRDRGGVVERLEIEGPVADPALWSRVGAELGRDWPAALGNAGPRRAADPVAALLGAGFVLIQDRETLRRPRHLLGIGWDSIAAGRNPGVADGDPVAAAKDPAAELVIDSVTYVAAGTPMRHHEVEIEAGPGMQSQALTHLGAALRALFPAELQPWRPSKLRTGLALEALARSHGPQTLVDASGNLSDRAYVLLQELQHRGRPDHM